MKRFLLLFLATMALPSFAQFSSDKVLVYVKAGEEPSKSKNIVVIGYFDDSNEIMNWSSSADQIRKTIVAHPNYFRSPYNIPDKMCTLYTSYIAPKRCKYNTSASTSKYRVFSGRERSGYDPVWMQYVEGGTKNWAFSSDGKKMIFWISGNEDNRETYLLTELSEFDPSTSSSSNYDFLE